MAKASKRLSLAETNPEFVPRLVDPSVADEVHAGSTRKVEWRCEIGHVYVSPVSNVVQFGRKCNICTGKVVVAGINDLLTTHPEVVDEVVDVARAKTLSAGSNKMLRWRCRTCGYEWEASPNSRLGKNSSGCPCCAGKVVVAGVNDLATVEPEIASQLVDKSLGKVLARTSNKRVEWECSNGHRWVASVSSRTSGGCGCPYCSGRKAVAGTNDLATTHPELTRELVDISVGRTLSAGSKKFVMWRCERGHTWESMVQTRAIFGAGCPYCSGRVPVVGENDLATLRPDFTDISAKESAFADMVRFLVGDDAEVVTNDRTVFGDGRELDVVIPSLGVAFEFNGVFWHSEAMGRDLRYYAQKVSDARSRGYKLFCVWEDDWDARHDLVVRMVASKLGAACAVGPLLETADEKAVSRTFARKLLVREIGSREARAFLDANHIQGAVSAMLHLGLVDGEGDIRALLSVRSPRENARMRRSEGEWEVQRYATRGQVVGGFSRLLVHAQRVLCERGCVVSRWVSFSSNDVSDGTMYERCGFSLDGELAPDYRYAGRLTGWQRKPKESFQKKDFRRRPDLVWEEGWTEHTAAIENGLVRCFDSGKRRWVRDVG